MVKVEFLGGVMDGQSQLISDDMLRVLEVGGPDGNVHRYKLLVRTDSRGGDSQHAFLIPAAWDAEQGHDVLKKRLGRKPGQVGKMSL